MEENKNTTIVDEGMENDSSTSKTYTQEEVDALLQREGDRRVSDALKKAERKTAERVKEAQKLAQMNEQDKFVYELEQREKAIAEKEKALALAENKNEASKILAEKGLSLSLVDFVVAEDAETMSANISLLDKAFKASVKAEVEKRLGSSAPKKNTPAEGMTIEQARKLSVSELNQLAIDNPDIFNQLFN